MSTTGGAMSSTGGTGATAPTGKTTGKTSTKK